MNKSKLELGLDKLTDQIIKERLRQSRFSSDACYEEVLWLLLSAKSRLILHRKGLHCLPDIEKLEEIK